MAFAELSDDGYRGWSINDYVNKFDLNLSKVGDNVERISVEQVTTDQFVERYEKLYKPVVVTGACENWKAKYKWTLPVSLKTMNIVFTLINLFFFRD